MVLVLTRKYYKFLYKYHGQDEELRQFLNDNGACNWTICPECCIDDFTHTENCSLYQEVKRELEFEEECNLDADVTLH